MASEPQPDIDDFQADELKPGTELLHGQYTIEGFLNAGGFGVTYLAKDSLNRTVVIKECYPAAMVRRTASRGARPRRVEPGGIRFDRPGCSRPRR